MIQSTPQEQCFKNWDIGFAAKIPSINKIIFDRFQDVSVAPSEIGPKVNIPSGGTYGESLTTSWEDVRLSNINLQATNVYVHEGRLDFSFKSGNIYLTKLLVKPDGQPLVKNLAPMRYILPLAGKTITFRARIIAYQVEVIAISIK